MTSVARSEQQGRREQSDAAAIVVGYDAGPAAEQALTWALDFAARHGDRVVLVSAAEHGDAASRRAELPFLERADVIDAEVVADVRDGPPAQMLLSAAAAHGAEIIVVGDPSHRLLGLPLTSTCDELIERSEVPVVIVPSCGPASGSGSGSGVIVGYDGRDDARGALAWALRASPPEDRIALVTALGRERSPLPLARLAPSLPGEVARVTERIAREWADDGAALDDLVDLDFARGEPSIVLAHEARRRHARLIVIGHRRDRRAERLRASVARDLLRIAPCPVAVVP